MSVLSIVRRTADDIRTGAGEVVQQGAKGLSSPIGIAGLGGSGAWAYSSYSDQQQEAQQTERYQTYQERVSEIEAMYEAGQISRKRRNELLEDAREAYLAADDEEPRGLGLTDVVARMTTTQLVAVSIGLTTVGYFVLRPIAVALARNVSGPEELFG